MALRPRKVFANPFVVTLATLPACFVESSPPPQQPQQPVATAPRPTEQTSGEVIIANPPRPPRTEPTQTGPAPGQPTSQPVAFDQRWTVQKRADGCQAMAQVNCPKPTKTGAPVPTCNPPPPMKIACPDGWDGTTAMTVVQYANHAHCEVERVPMDCPKGAMCKPGPPRIVSCPTWQ
ncbi:MAG TPA: hypothetical protein VK427_20235 [Kofleriaceae bacterium]|nr:hypothetical protein [Kofleriaceae bacterium]